MVMLTEILGVIAGIVVIALIVSMPFLILRTTCKAQFPEMMGNVKDTVLGVVVLIGIIFLIIFVFTAIDNIGAYFKNSGEVTAYPIWRINNRLETGKTVTYQVWVNANRVLVKVDDNVSKFGLLPSKKCEVNDIYNWICHDEDNFTIQMINKKYSDNVPLPPWAHPSDEPVAYVSWWEWYLLKYRTSLPKGGRDLITSCVEAKYNLKSTKR